jgi:hypothetical protein
MEQDDEKPSSSNASVSERSSTTKRKRGDDNSVKKQESSNKLSVETMSNHLREQEEKKLKLCESHLKAMEVIEKEQAFKRAERDKLSRSSELKTIEEMLQMKRSEVKEYESSDPERRVVENQLKLRRKRDQLMESVCGFQENDDNDDDRSSITSPNNL